MFYGVRLNVISWKEMISLLKRFYHIIPAHSMRPGLDSLAACDRAKDDNRHTILVYPISTRLMAVLPGQLLRRQCDCEW
jgi:hypothetical protein